MIYKNKDFIYDSETGGLIHAREKSRGCPQYKHCSIKPFENGYLYTNWHGRQQGQHVVAYFMVHKHLPRRIRHKNGIKTDNQIDNLIGVM